MKMREMSMSFQGVRFYESTFDPVTGSCFRSVHVEFNEYEDGRVPSRIRAQLESTLRDYLASNPNIDPPRSFFDRRLFGKVWSPVPELVDVQITNQCPVGCDYCYQDSTHDDEHGRSDLIDQLIAGFDHPPYEIAIGGGEPTQHPDFARILKRCWEAGSVPSYTTSGIPPGDDVIEATNAYCGSVAMSYHSHLGWEWFRQRFQRLRDQLEVPMHVHLVATRDVVEHLDDLIEFYDQAGPFEIVLLAYYPQGRGDMSQIMPKSVYQDELPERIRRIQQKRIPFSFSEGLIPYVLSRPDLELNYGQIIRSEGYFSCYVDADGHMAYSSFADEDAKTETTIWEEPSQKLWDLLQTPRQSNGPSCQMCKHRPVCGVPHETHYLQCAYSEVNGGLDQMEANGDMR